MKKIDKFNQDYILILIWHFKNYVIDKKKNKKKKIKLIIPFPKLKLIRDFLIILDKFLSKLFIEKSLNKFLSLILFFFCNFLLS